MASQPLWRAWFTGSGKLFLNQAVPKLVVVSGRQHLDTDLVVAQMQVVGVFLELIGSAKMQVGGSSQCTGFAFVFYFFTCLITLFHSAPPLLVLLYQGEVRDQNLSRLRPPASRGRTS